MYIGIDLGTSNSVIAGIVEGNARVFRPADGGEVLPSMIYADKRGHRLYGRRAHDQALIAPDSVASGFKRLMGSSTPIEIKGAGLTLTPEECSADIIRQLLGQASTETGQEDFTGAIVTIPAAFNQMQSEATLRAAKLAGLEHVDLLQEPVAAALAAMAGAKRSGQFIVYDLGGGTFDVALVQAIDGAVSIVDHRGINMMGGRDFDRMIVNAVVRPWLAETFDLPDTFQRDPAYARLIRVAHLAAEKAKIDLSALDEASIFASDDEVRMLDIADNEIFLDVPITRARFEDLIRSTVKQTVDLVRTMLDESNYSHEDIDRIVFIGGPSRIPLVREMVSNELGIAADLHTDPMTAVAVGAAYYCESRQWSATAANASAPSEPKAVQASEPAPEEPGLSFDYAQRTPDEKVTITVRLEKPLSVTRLVRVADAKGGWQSDTVPLSDHLLLAVPLREVGDNRFTIQVMDEDGKPLPDHDHAVTITRTVAAVASIPAAHTLAVKALDKPEAQENVLFPLVGKGMTLPANGKAQFTSGRALRAGGPGSISFELFQVEYPERVDLNLCIGLFQLEGRDLPDGVAIRPGDPIVFDWTMTEGGILQATVTLAEQNVSLKVPRFYSPQAGQISFDRDQGVAFAEAVLERGTEEWGDIAAALGPESGPELQLLKTRLVEQGEIIEESRDDPETVRRVVEETRFIRQDLARLARKYPGPLLQRRLGKMTAVFNHIARAKANADENERFDGYAARVQSIIDDADAGAFPEAQATLGDMRALFFTVAWRDQSYVVTWFNRLSGESHLYPDQQEYAAMVAEGKTLKDKDDLTGLRDLVGRMLDARVALGASDIAAELATIVKA